MPDRFSRPIWMLVQAAAICGGMWLSFLGPDAPQQPVTPAAVFVSLAGWTILVAFLTAVVTNLWDWAHRKLQGFRSPGLTTVRPEHHDSVEKGDGRSAWLRRGELGKPPTTLR